MLVAVWQHRQKASALDSGVDLALKNRARAGKASGNDLAVFRNKVTQGVDVFVVDFFDAGSGKAAKALALEQQGLCIALRALVFIKTFWSGHDGLLKKWVIRCDELGLTIRLIEYERRYFCWCAR